MTKSARKKNEIEKIRERILENALQILITHGFKDLTMRKIASKNKMSATNLYNYFSNKDEIYLTIVIKGFNRLYSSFHEVDTKENDPVQKCKKMIREYISFGIHNIHYYDIMFTRSAPRYNDYVGTPLENLAKTELELSMKLLDLGKKAVMGVLKKRQVLEDNEIQMRVMQVWSLLHGMISIRNSKNIVYITDDPHGLFENSIEDVLSYII